jgi:Regulator of chromosome condensation (RCC1) repeat
VSDRTQKGRNTGSLDRPPGTGGPDERRRTRRGRQSFGRHWDRQHATALGPRRQRPDRRLIYHQPRDHHDASAPTTGIHLALGANHSLAVTAAGVVYTFGGNASSQLGEGTAQGRSTPDTISGLNHDWKVGTPTFNTNPGTYNVEKSVVVSDATPGATVHYTLTGIDPTEAIRWWRPAEPS